MLFMLMMWLESDLARMRAVGSAKLTQTSGLVAQNESSRLSEELSTEREQQQLTPFPVLRARLSEGHSLERVGLA